MKKFLWRFIHNVIAHPLLVVETKWTVAFHDWTAEQWEALLEKKK